MQEMKTDRIEKETVVRAPRALERISRRWDEALARLKAAVEDD
ncbi:MAG TPA: hypothetical protein VGD78_11350 [Chthoniobacterales bacterium]